MAVSNPLTPGRIFISYRRDETAFPASWLYQHLAAHFGADQVFKDVDSIELGDDFAEVIANAVGACDVLLVLIGAEWLAITDEAGRPRLEHSDDFVRLEVEAALQRKVRIIPILVGGARMPDADQLPESLGKLARRQALELNPNRFEADTRRLVRVVEKTLAEEEARRAAKARRAGEENRLSTVQTRAASLRADGQDEVATAEAALRRLASDESERVAQAAQTVLQVWEGERRRRESEAGRRTAQADEERQPQEPPEETQRPVLPPAKFVASVPPIDAADGESATVPIGIPASTLSGDTPAGVRPARRLMMVAGLGLAGLLVAGGIAYLQYGRDGAEGEAGVIPSAGASTGPTATPRPNTPPDELCTNEIKSNRRWVCLTSAVLAKGTLTIKYDVDYDKSTPDIHGGFHVHIYGSDGKNPPDSMMGTQAPKSQQSKYRYYWVDREPAVLHTDDGLYSSAIGDFPKVCARIAVAGHGLVHDNKGGYRTGNCVRITRS